jgi:hypothetical protein
MCYFHRRNFSVKNYQLGTVVHGCNPSVWEVETRESQIQLYNQTGLHTMTLSQKNKRLGWAWWLKSVILATWKAEAGRIVGRVQPRQEVSRLHFNH